MIGDIFGEIKNKLTGGAGTAAAAGLANGLLYAFFHQFLPDGTPEPAGTDSFLRQAGVPDIVRQKANYANATLDYIHKHWGVSYHDMTDISDTNSAIRLALKQALGMEPRDYLAKVVPLPNNAPRISGVFIGSVNLSSAVSNLFGGGAGSLTSTILQSNPVTAVPASVANIAQSVFGNVLKNLIQWNPPDTWKQAYPMPQDWNGYQALTQVGRYVPSVNDPLGITGYDGVAMGRAQLALTSPVQQSEAGMMNVTANSAGFDKAGVVLLLGAVGVLAYMWTKGKIK